MTKTKPYWGDRLALACVIYLIAVEVLAWAVDFGTYLRTGRFFGNDWWPGIMVWPLALGLLLTGVAVASRPRRGHMFACTILMQVFFGAGLVVTAVILFRHAG